MPFTAAFADLEPHERYKLLIATVIPRPIALVTSIDEAGVVNAAPFSFFNVFSEDPPLIVLGLQHKATGSAKDTTRNIARSGVFVVNLVDEALAEAMNVCAIDFPPSESEIDAAGLSLVQGVEVPVPRIAQAPFSLECRKTVSLAFGPHRELLVGEALRLHAREGLVDPERLRVNADAYHPVGRLFGDAYARQRDRFELKRESFVDVSRRQGRG
jgi:flavin reductase (DIM6/NTAB) family NADH-FMN oxidoreductase RutF